MDRLKNALSKFSIVPEQKPMTLDDIEVQVEEPRYPGKISKAWKASLDLFMKVIWNPLVTVWNFLDRYTTLTFWILVSIFVGILLGYFQPEFSQEIAPLGTAFIRMIKIVVAPLIFSTLVIGIAGHSEEISVVGKLAIKCIVYFIFVTVCALAIGLIMANLVKPGFGVNLPPEADDAATALAENSHEISWHGQMFTIIPENFFIAASEDAILGIVFCAAMFACATIKADKTSRDFMLQICGSLSQIIFKMVGLIMNYAPIGIGASLAATVGKNGIDVLSNLGKLIGAVYAALVIFALIVLLPMLLVCRIPLLPFIKTVGQPWIIAFSSASSESALPKAMERMREFGCPNSLVAFVIPCGYSFNLDGTTLYLSLASIFCAQAAGMHLPVSTQLSILGTLILSSKGVAAVPRASLVVLAGTAAQYGLPLSAVTMIMGVDAIMDMARTSLNVVGNCLACCVMARIEGRFRGVEWKAEEEERRRRIYLAQQKNSGDDKRSMFHTDSLQPNEQVSDDLVYDEEKGRNSSSDRQELPK